MWSSSATRLIAGRRARLKEEVRGAPLVKVVSQQLRAHGPTWLGQLGLSLFTSEEMQVEDDGVYPRLEVLFEKLVTAKHGWTSTWRMSG